ncbi:MAG: caspase family protein [Planctomycetota bacterium]
MNQPTAIFASVATIALLVASYALTSSEEVALKSKGSGTKEARPSLAVDEQQDSAVKSNTVESIKSVDSVMSPPQPQPDFATGTRSALLIGVSHYSSEQLAKLPGAEPDVSELAKVLERNGFSSNRVTLMTNRQGAENPRHLPTASRIRKQLKQVTANRDPNDSLIIALAGHGVQPQGGEYYFCPQDADPNDFDSLLAIHEIYQALDECQAGFKLLLIDACREDLTSGTSGDGMQSVTRASNATQQNLPEPPDNTAAFFSCSPGQLAYERQTEETTHGVFFHALIRGLEGTAAGDEGRVTLPDVERFVKKDVESFVRKTYSATQQPVIRNNTHGLVPLVAFSKTERQLKQARFHWVRGRREEALTIANRLVEQYPADGLALAERARMLADWAEEENNIEGVQSALELSEQAIRLAPDHAEPYVARASIHRILKSYQSAMADCDLAIERDLDCAMAYVQRAALHQIQQSQEAMLRDIQKAIEIDDEEPTARSIYAAFLFSIGRMDDGFVQLEIGLTKTPDVPILHFMKGYGLDQQKNYDKAIMAYTAAIRLDEQDDDLYCRRAVSLAYAGDFPGAIEDVSKAEQLDPENTDIVDARVVILIRQRKFQQAVTLLDQAIAQRPDRVEWRQHRASLLRSLGR